MKSSGFFPSSKNQDYYTGETTLDPFLTRITLPLARHAHSLMVNHGWARTKAEKHMRLRHDQNPEEMRHLSANIDDIQHQCEGAW
jgi:hypothetical protein